MRLTITKNTAVRIAITAGAIIAIYMKNTINTNTAAFTVNGKLINFLKNDFIM
jgi:hypothetical protein